MTEEIIGQIVEGSVINVADFGAFISIEGKEEGLVHISEIANQFITDIHQYVKVGDKVKVKVMGRNAKKKLELSIKKAIESLSDGETVRKLPRSVKKKTRNSAFEDRLHTFMKRSEERQIDFRRNLKNKQGITKRKK